MLIPYSTDAPIYHWPAATLGTIVLNGLIFAALIAMPEDQQDWVANHFMLVYGAWNPLQWITSNYLHAGLMHVLGNMAVLWGIGIIVEGKIGWWRFLLVYNLIGVFQCAVEQTLMLGASEGASLGASAIIYGGSSTSLSVAAPSNVMGTVDVTVVTGAGSSALTPADRFTYSSAGPAPSVSASTRRASSRARLASIVGYV